MKTSPRQAAFTTQGAAVSTFVAFGLLAPLLFGVLLVLASPFRVNQHVWEVTVFPGFLELAVRAAIVTLPLALVTNCFLWWYSDRRGHLRTRGQWYLDLLWVSPVLGIAFSLTVLAVSGSNLTWEHWPWYVAGIGTGVGSALLAIEVWYRSATS